MRGCNNIYEQGREMRRRAYVCVRETERATRISPGIDILGDGIVLTILFEISG